MISNRKKIRQLPFTYQTVPPQGEQTPIRSYERLSIRMNALESTPSWPKTHFRSRVAPLWYRVAIAASFTLVFGMGLTLWKTQKAYRNVKHNEWSTVAAQGEQEYFSPKGTRSRIILPDSSAVWLNADSRLLVQNDFGARERVTRLTGEAYFEVTPDPLRQFIVRTSDVDIKVMGTTFNVSAYPDDITVRTVLVAGEVMLGENLYLKPAQMASLQKKSKKMEIQEDVRTEIYTSWRHGTLSFYDTPMPEVIKALERWFNVTILLQDERLQSYVYTASFTSRSLEQILTYISYSAPINYTINKDTVMLTLKR